MNLARLISVTGLIATLLACSGEPKPEEAPPAEAPSAALPPGLVAFDDGKSPLTTAIPAEGAAQDTQCDDAGCRYVFGLPGEDGKPRPDASVTFDFPAGSPGLATLRDTFVNGEDGLFAENPTWLAGQKSGGHPSMPWMQEVVSFSAGETTVGRIMIGKAPMGNFVVTEVLDKEVLEDARPIIAAIYTHLDFPASR